MRYWLFSLAFALFVVAATVDSIGAQKKDTGKDAKKDVGKEPKKDAGKDNKMPEFKEPSEVAGKTFLEWKKEIHSLDPSKRETAMKTIMLFGPNKAYEALPEMLAELGKHKAAGPRVDLSVRVNGIEAVGRIFATKKDPDPKYVKDALAIFRTSLKDTQVIMRVRALQWLPSLGMTSRDAIDDVFKLCKDIDTWEVKREAIKTLAILAKDKEQKVPPRVYLEFRDGAKDNSEQVRMVALQAFAAVRAPDVPPEVLKGLDDPSLQVRMTALNCLANLAFNMSPQDRAIAISRLKSHLELERDSNLNLWTHAAIMTISKKIGKEHMDAVLKRLKNSDPAVRLQALQVISAGGTDSKLLAGKAVMEAVHDPDIHVGVAAIATLVHMHCFEAIPMLEKISKDAKANEVLKDAALDALDNFSLLDKLLKEKKDKDKDKKAPEKK